MATLRQRVRGAPVPQRPEPRGARHADADPRDAGRPKSGQTAPGRARLPARAAGRAGSIIASTGGASWNPAWLHNLAKDPDATIEFGDGRRSPVRAESLDGADLEAAWKRIEAEATQYADYRTKTDREITVVRLRERPAA